MFASGAIRGVIGSDVCRRRKGNAMLLSVALVGVLMAIACLGITLVAVSIGHQKLGSEADRLSLSLAKILNCDDRAGQMNNLVACAREGVFISRKTYNACQDEHRHLSLLGRQILDEARDGALLIEKERRQLLASTLYEVQSQAEEILNPSLAYRLPYLDLKKPSIDCLEVGYLKNGISNVPASAGSPELTNYDRSSGYLSHRGDLYLGNIDARLPAPDNDLSFKLATVPAPERNYIPQTSLVQEKAVSLVSTLLPEQESQSLSCEQIPSAVRLIVSMQVSDSAAGKRPEALRVGSQAQIGGACPLPR